MFPKELDPGGAAGLHLHQGTGGPWVGKRVRNLHTQPTLAWSHHWQHLTSAQGRPPEGPGQAGAGRVSRVSRLEQGSCRTSLPFL